MTRWTGVYADSWQQEDLVPTAFAHPAKVSKGLSFRIIQHLIRQGYLQAGHTILDPFAGIGGFALACLAAGLRYVGVELEPRFVDCANGYPCDGQPGPLPNLHTPQAPLPTARCGQTLTHEPHTVLGNLELWRRRYGFTGATVVQGDSRCLRAVLAGAAAQGIVSSPPYAGAGALLGTHNGLDYAKSQPGTGTRKTPARNAIGEGGYGATPGQLGAAPPGSLEAVLSSPPYSGNEKHDYRVTDDAGLDRDERRGKCQDKGCFRGSETYGQTPGNLGTMPAGCVGSPPFCQSDNRGNRTEFDTLQAKVVRDGKGHGGKLGPSIGQHYGTSPAQLGNASPNTFWSAAATILQELWHLLPPGAPAVWVLKAYVSKGKIVDFPRQWEALCHQCGFVTAEWIEASLVEHHGCQETLFDGPQEVQTARMSFFRRLHVKKRPDLAINEEIVLITMRGT